MASTQSKFIIGPGRLSFPKIFVPNDAAFGGKYACTLLLPPTYDFSSLKAALKQAAINKFGPDMAKWPRGLRGPNDVIRKCEEKSHLAGYEPGWFFVSASSADMPGVVDAALNKVSDPKEAYAGRWASMSVNVFAFSNVKHGVSLGLQNVQLRKHDDSFSGRLRAEDEFEEQVEDMEEFDRSSAGTSVPSVTSTQTSAASGWDD